MEGCAQILRGRPVREAVFCGFHANNSVARVADALRQRIGPLQVLRFHTLDLFEKWTTHDFSLLSEFFGELECFEVSFGWKHPTQYVKAFLEAITYTYHKSFPKLRRLVLSSHDPLDGSNVVHFEKKQSRAWQWKLVQIWEEGSPELKHIALGNRRWESPNEGHWVSWMVEL